MSSVCIWKNCNKEQSNTRSYKNCNKCMRSVGSVYSDYCEHHRYGVSEITGCRYMIPWTWSCYECYSENFTNWKPDPENFIPEDWP